MNTRFIIAFAALLVFCVPVVVLSQAGGNTQEVSELNTEIKERQVKIKQIEASIADTKKRIATVQTKAQSLKNQLSYLDNRALLIEDDISLTEEKLAVLDIEITSLTLSIEDKEVAIEKQQAMIGELVRAIYFENDKGYLEIAASYDSFSDFYNRLQYLQSIEKDLGKAARGLRIAKADIEEKKVRFEDRKESYVSLKKQLVEKKQDLDEQSVVKESLLLQTRSSELTYQALLRNLRKKAESIENEISSIEQQVRNKLAEQDKLDQLTGDPTTLSWPTPSRYITSRFRDPEYPYRNIFEHNAIDIRAAHGTPIRAAASGYVGRAKRCSLASCFSYVMIVHSGGLSTVYAHLSSVLVNADQFVNRGDIIGYSGGTPGTPGAGPFVTGPHHHFEVRRNGIPVNPLQYLVRDY